MQPFENLVLKGQLTKGSFQTRDSRALLVLNRHGYLRAASSQQLR